jgi:L-aspartate oxidase
VIVDQGGATSIAGLFAIGEVACTGLHGANRLASNSLLEAVVMADRASAGAAALLKNRLPDVELPQWEEGRANDPDELVVVIHNWREIRQLMWDYVGIVRSTKRLQRARSRLSILQQEIQEYYWDFKVTADLLELRNLAQTSMLIVESALQRHESRGLHATLDYPGLLPEAKDSVLQLGSAL